MNLYKHIFFDLDRTLWDFDTNSYQTLSELSIKYNLHDKGITSFDEFINQYLLINEQMWADYRKGLIDKQTLRYARFQKTLLKFKINDFTLSEAISNDYIACSPLKTNLFPHTIETLKYLNEKYHLHIITNGFEEVQHLKIRNCEIEHYFKQIITSERTGFKKPDIRIFQYAMNLVNATSTNCLMIGDCIEADIIGARDAGMHQVFFNPKGEKHLEKVTYEINNLNALLDFL